MRLQIVKRGLTNPLVTLLNRLAANFPDNRCCALPDGIARHLTCRRVLNESTNEVKCDYKETHAGSSGFRITRGGFGFAAGAAPAR